MIREEIRQDGERNWVLAEELEANPATSRCALSNFNQPARHNSLPSLIRSFLN